MHVVLTALLDGDDSIKKTAQSLIPQLTERVQWVIKNSAMRSTAVLNELEKYPQITVLYQKDSSLYEGLNQGLEYCNGEYLQVVGAGDEFRPGAIAFISELESSTAVVDSIFLGVHQKRNGREIIPNPGELNKRMACPHPGAILNLQKVKELGGFNTSYRIASDYDLLSRFIKIHTKCKFSSQIIIDYEGGGMSETSAVEGFIEEELIRFRVWNQNQVESVLSAHKFFNWAKSKLGV